MKLLAVCQADEPGGAELGLLRLVRRLAERGWDVTLTTPTGGSLSRAGYAWVPLDVGGLAAGGGGRALAPWARGGRVPRQHRGGVPHRPRAGRPPPAARRVSPLPRGAGRRPRR